MNRRQTYRLKGRFTAQGNDGRHYILYIIAHLRYVYRPGKPTEVYEEVPRIYLDKYHLTEVRRVAQGEYDADRGLVLRSSAANAP
jgi:hypothetical protein